MRLHIPSLAIGLAACAVVFVTMSQALPTGNSPRIEYGPHPRDMIQIKEGVAFTVPANHTFVLTGLGNTDLNSANAYLYVDGNLELRTYNGSPYEDPCSVLRVPTGFTVGAGRMIQVNIAPSGGTGRAWGYLAK